MEPLYPAGITTTHMIILTFIGLTTVAVAFFLYVALRARPRTSHPDELASRLRSVDLGAFKNLADPVQTRRLAGTLSQQQFRMLQRHRTRAMMKYLQSASHNAAIAAQLGAMLQKSQSSATAEAGRMMSHQALTMRLYAAAALVTLRWQYVFPGAEPPMQVVLQRYEEFASGLQEALAVQGC